MDDKALYLLMTAFKSYRKASKMTGKNHLQLILLANKLPFVMEYQGIPDRKFRFDFCIVDLKVAIEYEGIISSKARHTSITGYTNDCIKYNLAAINGWRILRYTALNYQDFESDLNQLINYNADGLQTRPI